MQNQFKQLTGLLGVQLLVICFTSFATLDFNGSLTSIKTASFIPVTRAEPASQELPSGWESYLDRPDILNLSAKAQNLGKSWESLKAAHFSFVAELLALYPAETTLYFLARDSEHLYDVARLVTEGTSESQRVRLINVSSVNMRDANLKAYLKENGLSEETLAAGNKAVFVDTGFAGTIPRIIGELFPPELSANLKSHFIVSTNTQHPSSRAFLIHLSPMANEKSPENMLGTIFSYEHMVRYTDRSSRFFFSKGRYHALSPTGQSLDGAVSKAQSLLFMNDLKAEWQKPETKARFQAERRQFQELKSLLSEVSESSHQELKVKLKTHQDNFETRLLEAQIRDILEAQKKAGLNVRVTLEELGLKLPSELDTPVQHSKKNDLMKKFPEWAPLLEKPEVQIPELFKNKNWQMIGNLIDANVDVEINGLLVKALFDEPATGAKKDLQWLLLKKADAQMKQHLAEYITSQPQAKAMSEFIKLLIEGGDVRTLRKLARYTFSQEHASEMIDLLRLLIEKADAKTLEALEVYSFSQPFAKTPEHRVLKKSLKITDLVQRKNWLEAEFAKLKAVVLVPKKDFVKTKAISSSLKVGDVVNIKGRFLKVIKKSDEGRRGIVFQVQADTGAFYALKTMKNSDPEARALLAKELSKATQWQELRIPHSKVLVQEKEFVLKTWIEGLRGDEVVDKYAAGEAFYQVAAESLLRLVAKIRSQGAYVGDFRPANLIWAGKAWVIIDSGSVQQGMTLEEAQEKWSRSDKKGPKFERRWKLPLPAAPIVCSKIFLMAG